MAFSSDNQVQPSLPSATYSREVARLSSAYYAERTPPAPKHQNDHVARIAAARLHALLADARLDIGGVFTRREALLLMDCFIEPRFRMDEVLSIASAVCEASGIEPDEYENSQLAPLIKKLLCLSDVEKLALADALEQAWRGTGPDRAMHLDAFTALGIRLIDDSGVDQAPAR